jgi:transcription initiation factor TFIIIB Brf1 subunit/transcription initiation factor TFIIB
MGQALFGEARPTKNGECPTCRSEVWKFAEPATAVCSICGQTASLVPVQKGIKWVYRDSKNSFTKDHLEEHFHDWLRGKVQEFITRRKELALVRDPYKGNDTWLTPLKA